MKKDIESREDLYLLVKEFYVKLLDDKLMSPFFEEIIQQNKLEEHLQILVDFWDNMLFYSGKYKRNAMEPHLKMHFKKPFEKIHFNTWLKHFTDTVDTYFEGEIARAAKTRALSIATVMEIKVTQINDKQE